MNAPTRTNAAEIIDAASRRAYPALTLGGYVAVVAGGAVGVRLFEDASRGPARVLYEFATIGNGPTRTFRAFSVDAMLAAVEAR